MIYSWQRKPLLLFFQCCNSREVELKECSSSFTIKSELSTYLMGTFKNIEYNSICKFPQKFFLIARILHSTVLIHFGQREKTIL